jgi:FkbM family methyltransferase
MTERLTLRRRVGKFTRAHPKLRAYVDRALRARAAWQQRLPASSPAGRVANRRVALTLPRLEHAPRPATMVAPNSMYIPRMLVKTGIGGYEPNSLACFLAVTDAAPPGPIWDVGANVGVYGLIARGATDREVIAFEPTPDLARVARVTADANGLPYRVMELALSDRTGEMTLYLSDVTDSSNSLREGFRKSSKQLAVKVETADSLVGSGELRPPAVMKIDTEATEPAVLRGAMGLIRERRPWLLVEVLATRTPDDLMAVLKGLDYTWYHISGALPYQPQDVIYGDTTYKDLMWLFAPQPVTDEFFERMQIWSDAISQCVPPTAAPPPAVAATAPGQSQK